MRTYTQQRRRLEPVVESLEGKTLLSTGAMMPQVAPHVMAVSIGTHQEAALSGTLMGPYSSVHAPFFAFIQSYNTTGTLTPTGSTHLVGTLFVRPTTPAGRFVGQLLMRNSGGAMILNIFASGVANTYTDKVAFANGSDHMFTGEMGTLTIVQMQTHSVPYVTWGQATMTFA